MNEVRGASKKSFYLYKSDEDYINDYAEKNSLTKSEALRKILKEHKTNSYVTSEELHEKLSNGIYENLKNDFAPIKFIDNNVSILIEMLNCFLINNVKESDSFITSDDFKSPILEMAEETVQNRIYKNYYKKNKEVK